MYSIGQGKARPLLITVVNANQRNFIWRNASKLRKSSQYKNVYISSDLSPKQREVAKELRAELARRRSRGERNIVIRRGTIVTINCNSSTDTYVI